jgi:hypothetical protein
MSDILEELERLKAAMAELRENFSCAVRDHRAAMDDEWADVRQRDMLRDAREESGDALLSFMDDHGEDVDRAFNRLLSAAREDREDAERYREIRARADAQFIMDELVGMRIGRRLANLSPSAAERFDAAIDAARKGQGE